MVPCYPSCLRNSGVILFSPLDLRSFVCLVLLVFLLGWIVLGWSYFLYYFSSLLRPKFVVNQCFHLFSNFVAWTLPRGSSWALSFMIYFLLEFLVYRSVLYGCLCYSILFCSQFPPVIMLLFPSVLLTVLNTCVILLSLNNYLKKVKLHNYNWNKISDWIRRNIFRPLQLFRSSRALSGVHNTIFSLICVVPHIFLIFFRMIWFYVPCWLWSENWILILFCYGPLVFVSAVVKQDFLFLPQYMFSISEFWYKWRSSIIVLCSSYSASQVIPWTIFLLVW